MFLRGVLEIGGMVSRSIMVSLYSSHQLLMTETNKGRRTIREVTVHPWGKLLHYGGETVVRIAGNVDNLVINEREVLCDPDEGSAHRRFVCPEVHSRIMAVRKGRRNTAHMAHLSSNDKGIERVWVNAAAARRRASFCNAFEVVVQYGLIKKAPNIKLKVSHIGGIHPVHMKSKMLLLYFAIVDGSGVQVKGVAERTIEVAGMMMMADVRCRYRLRLLAVAEMVALLAGIIQDRVW
ncbi:hypothetical protein GOBAR_AA11322 [Gossypium barbadense]|uniref:Uncharacterized protein n=1 Tax=Gossypium barbadense TaxID=3634 RepID=A0A2P5Y166_GOSBA|nr:hypothetical protein GOBAR_AA11322 [Gossypium barbadense]